MKNIILTLAVLLFGGVTFMASAQASTIATLLPSVDTVSTGQSFDLAIMVDPQGTANYTEKVEIDYPADILQVNSFTLDKSWMALTQPGYDSLDNNAGVLVKTAGYAGGFTSPVTFGAISFTAKKAGSGVVTIGNSSLAFEVNSQSGLLGNSSIIKVVSPTTQAVNPAPVVQTNTNDNSSIAPVVQVAQDPIGQSAAVDSATTPDSGLSMWVWILIVVVVIILGLVVYFFRE